MNLRLEWGVIEEASRRTLTRPPAGCPMPRTLPSRRTLTTAALVCVAAGLVVALVASAGCPSPSPSAPQAPPAEEPPAGPPLFEDVTAKAGIDFTYRNGEDAGHFAIIESLGGGVALFDF